MTTITIRRALTTDQSFLEEMFYESLYVPAGSALFPRDITQRPDLAKYVENLGQKAGDLAFVAADDATPVGAVWSRLLVGDEKGYGYVDDDTPEAGVALRPAYRGQGLGTRLFEVLFAEAAPWFDVLSLSVSKEGSAQQIRVRLVISVGDDS